MTRRNAIPVLGSIVAALMLSIVPLPDSVEPFRPDWTALALIHWTIMQPERYSVGKAWLVGLVLDIAQGTLLGQHALALVAVTFLTSRFHLLLRVFPRSQLTVTVCALLAVYRFLLFWINGVAGIDAPAVSYWGPVLAGTIAWPLVTGLLSGRRFKLLARG